MARKSGIEIKVKFPSKQKFERDLKKAVAPAMRDLAAKRTRQYRDLSDHYTGGDIETVKRELVKLMKADGGSITDPELTEHAKAIVSGEGVEFRTS
jgi:adenylyl- and sulfurtransferase ThiI